MEPLTRKVLWLSLFAVTMAYLESAVVVYLRALYYPDGFEFPLVVILDRMAAIEIGREAATILMLLAVAALSGTTAWARFAVFCFTFGVWDIFYYIWLWVFLGWPPSLLTNDVLFLIPVPWISPVLAPVIVSLCLVAAAIVIQHLEKRGARFELAAPAWIPAIAGGLLVLLAFMLDFRVVLRGALPPPFRWWLFGAGIGLGLAALLFGARRAAAGLRSGTDR
jgi:hypothetical protein